MPQCECCGAKLVKCSDCKRMMPKTESSACDYDYRTQEVFYSCKDCTEKKLARIDAEQPPTP